VTNFCQLARSPKVFLATLLFISFSIAANAGTKVAFTGDQGTDENAQAVLALIANEGTDLLLIQGDLGYDPNSADAWNENITNALGGDFPVLSVVGNHEDHEWDKYHPMIKQHVDRAAELSCSDNPGVKAFCQFRNIEIVQASPGINEIDGVDGNDDFEQYIADKFSAPGNNWRICSWHKNMNALQVGSKSDSTGWGVYRSCLNAGAIVAVAHDHTYARTHLLSNFENQSVVHRNSEMTISPGQSFMFVSGLGGRSVRAQERGGDWWSSIYTSSQGATHGALFCDFEQTSAQCYFKAIDGSVPDQFSLQLGGENGFVSSNDSGSDNANVSDNEIIASVDTSIATDTSVDSADIPLVFQRTDSNEIRWVDRDVNGQLGSVWIDSACAESLGGADISGDWATLIELAPGIDSISSPCIALGEQSVDNQATNALVDEGFVFGRSDKNELRWIARNANGDIASVRIYEECAAKFGGVVESGDWFDLIEIAPAFDQIQNPCYEEPVPGAPIGDNTAVLSGYVLARTDKDEMRWIAATPSGEVGSIRINKVCAESLGGATASGDWDQLISLAPEGEVISHPCNEEGIALKSDSTVSGYVFKRTDISEYRWVAENSSGSLGNVWIDEACAIRLGSAQVSGDWIRLNQIAPEFDSLPYPVACLN